MTGLVIAGLLVGLAVAVAVPVTRRRPARRLARLRTPTGSTGDRATGESRAADPAAAPPAAGAAPVRPGTGGGRWLRRPDRFRLVAALAGVAAGALLGGWLGVLVGAGLAVAIDRGLRRLEPAGSRALRLAEAAELPLAADLLAVALRGGAPVDQATGAVAEVLPGPLGVRLEQVARMLRLGATAEEAWEHLAPVAGAGRLIRAAVRSAEHGGALADALSRLAADLRADRSVAAEAAARRASVLIVLPLGLCFLPAFMLAGLVPVIVAVLGDVL